MHANFWWVNHTHTSHEEIEGSYLWFPTRSNRSRGRSESEKNIQRLLPGDVVFSFTGGLIGALGVVLGAARESARPSEFAAVADYVDARSGWLVPVRFMPLAQPLHIQDCLEELTHVMPRKHAPLLSGGASNQHLALAAVPAPMAATLGNLLCGEVERIVGTIIGSAGRELADDAAEVALQLRTDMSAARKLDLLKSRHGQGAFRTNLELQEHSCRVTGVLDRRHLSARHIKPWSRCDDSEKLDGANGLLFSPHIAHLFERGYIAFTDEGDLLVSLELNPFVLENLQIRLPLNVGGFSPQQCHFLAYHRQEVFQQHGAGRRQKAIQALEAEEIVLEPATVQPA